MPNLERPRERLVKYGSTNLSDSELLAILLISGNSKFSAKDLAQLILKYCDGLKNLSNLNYETLIKIPGIKHSKACIILACIELAKRINQKVSDLNNIKRVIKDKLLFVGTLNYSLVHPREIFKEAYLLSASAFICVHNHPSGNINPSNQDIELTNNLVTLGNLHGIKVLDHIIIGKNKYYSFLNVL